MLLPRRRTELLMPVAVLVTMVPVAIAGWMLVVFEPGEPGFQLTERALWFQPWDISWNVGVDGISLLLVALTALLFPLSLLASRSITSNLRMYLVAMLVLETGLLGVFVSLDLVLFFVFFEMTLVPMYLLIGMWGSGNRVYAAVKFFLYTSLGSAFMLAAIIAIGVISGSQGGTTFDFVRLLDLELTSTQQLWLFLGFGIAFAVKVPLFPFHTWLPDAHTEAPTAGSVLLAGVLLKLGTYGFVRFNLTLFPEASVDLAPWLAGLAVVGIIYGAAVAVVQPDLKRLVAYSSVSHLGFIVLGTFALTTQGLQGGVIQMVNHGLTTGALFLLVGMLYDRTHTRQISDYGGVASVMPVLAGVFLFTAFASAGLPGLNGFIGEFNVLLGSYLSFPVAAIVATGGVLLAAVYLLWAYERVFTGPIDQPRNEKLLDLDLRERVIMAPLVVLIVFLGVYPKPALDRIEPAVESILDRVTAATDYEVPQYGRMAEVELAGRRGRGLMDQIAFLPIAPEVVLLVAALLVLLTEVTLGLGRRIWAVICTAAIVLSIGFSVLQWIRVDELGPQLNYSARGVPTVTNPMIVMDHFSAMAGLALFVVAGLALLAAWRLVAQLGTRGAEFVALILIAVAGLHVMTISSNLILLFIGLETGSISLYVMAGFTREQVRSEEAAMKYFLLGSLSSAIFLYGIALAFASTGSTSIYGVGGIPAFFEATVVLEPGIALVAVGLLVVGLGFKVSAAPFHQWAPDVYQGAPAAAVPMLAAAVKIAGFAAMARILASGFPALIDDWAPALAVVSALSVVLGTLGAIAQRDLKRMLAFSGVAHAGFIMSALVAGDGGIPAMWFYVATYAVSLVGAFTVVSVISGPKAERSPFEAYQGLAGRSPLLAALLALFMLGLAGFPLTAGLRGQGHGVLRRRLRRLPVAGHPRPGGGGRRPVLLPENRRPDVLHRAGPRRGAGNGQGLADPRRPRPPGAGPHRRGHARAGACPLAAARAGPQCAPALRGVAGACAWSCSSGSPWWRSSCRWPPSPR